MSILLALVWCAPALCQIPGLPRPGKFLKREIELYAAPTGGAIVVCTLFNTPAITRDLRFDSAAGTYRVPQVFQSTCPVFTTPQTTRTQRIEVQLEFSDPGVPPRMADTEFVQNRTVMVLESSINRSVRMSAQATSTSVAAPRMPVSGENGLSSPFGGFYFRENCSGQTTQTFNGSSGAVSGGVTRACSQSRLQIDAVPAPVRGAFVAFASTLFQASMDGLEVSVVERTYFIWEEPQVVTENLSVGEDIRVVQAVQMAGNKVPLVPGKSTIVFAPIISAGSRSVNFGGRISAYRNGTQIGVPIDALHTSSNFRPPSVTWLDSILRFNLPLEWTAEGALELEVEVLPESGFADTNPADNKRRTTVQFRKPLNWPEKYTVGYIKVCFPGVDAEHPRCPNEDKIALLGPTIQDLLPLPEQGLTFKALRHTPRMAKSTYAPNVDDLVRFRNNFKKLVQLSEAQKPGWADQYLAFTPAGSFPAAVSDPPWSVGSIARVLVVPTSNRLRADRLERTITHEISHNHGLRHTSTGAVCSDDAARTDTSQDAKTQWPFEGMTAINAAAWSQNEKKLVLFNTSDLMSYCYRRWVSPYSFEFVFQANAYFPATNTGDADPNMVTATPKPRSATGATEDILISGTIASGGGAAALEAGYRLPASASPPVSIGDAPYCLVFSSAAGDLGKHCFPVSFVDAADNIPLNAAGFSFRIPFPDGATRISLTNLGNEIAALSPGPRPPSLRIVNPQPGAIWSGGEQTIRWEASDPDGDPLAYAVFASSEDGSTWIPVEIDLTENEISFNASDLPGGVKARLRVYATDGIQTAFAEVGGIEVRQEPVFSVPDRLDVGEGLVNGSNSASLPLSNTGSGTVRVLTVTSSDSQFVPNPTLLPRLIYGGQSLPFPIRFEPKSTGDKTAILTIVVESPERREVRVSVTGRGVAAGNPALEVTPANIDFGTVALRSASEMILSVRNTGLATLNLASISLAGAGFTIDNPGSLELDPGESDLIEVTFAPTAEGRRTGSVTIRSNDPARPSVIVNLTGTTPNTTQPIPSISVSPEAVDFGASSVGQAKDLTLTVRNTGAVLLSITSLTVSGAQFSLPNAPALPLSVAAGGQTALTLRMNPIATGGQAGQLAIASNDPARGVVNVSLTGTATAATGASPPPGPSTVILSDSFNRTATDPCNLGRADNAQGGSGVVYYLPVFGGGTPAGGSLDGTALNQRGLDFGGVEFHTSATPCTSGAAFNLGADVYFRVDLLVPRSGQNITQAGPFFRARNAIRGDGIIGGENTGYWVQLFSTGEVKVKNLATGLYIASSDAITTFDASRFHTLDVSANGTQLQIWLDNTPVRFAGVDSVTIVSSANTGGGIAFSAETNRGLLGGQKADNLVVGRPPAGAPPPTAPAISVSPASLDFGQVTVGQSKDLAVTIRNTGTADLSVNDAAISGPIFSITGARPPLTIAPNGQSTLTIRVAPTAAGSQTGTLTLTGNDASRTTVVSLTVTGAAVPSGPREVTLQHDDGTFEQASGFPQGGVDATFLVRFTPPSYPATIKKIQIYVHNLGDGLAAGDSFTLVHGAHAGGETVSSPTLRETSGRISRVGAFNEFEITPVTITSGDFLAGILIANRVGLLPMAIDTTRPQGRSYSSTNGRTFSAARSVSERDGNLGVRVVVEVQ